MNDMASDPALSATGATRKPRVAIMGEFSAGKSTLSNLLLGARPLPEKVTATRLSPVWITLGQGAPVRVDLDGGESPIHIEEIEAVPLEETHHIRLPLEAEILRYCDLIDFPGISDPNMDPAVWERVLDEVDMVLWCTHATQAWRQSEAAVWEGVPEAVQARSLLLVTRFDKLTTERDRARVLHRVTTETEGLFGAIFPISLIQALASADDPEAWETSGAAAFADHLLDMLSEIDGAIATPEAHDTPSAAAAGAEPDETPDTAADPHAPAVTPRRVRAKGAGRRPRPPAD